MDDLISRAAAIAQIKENYCHWCDHIDLCQSCETQDCIATIEQQVPAVDAVPVVRCSECKRWETDWTPKGTIQGFHFCPMVGFVTREDFYCANGERRDGDI